MKDAVKSLLACLKAGEPGAQRKLDLHLRQIVELVKAGDKKAEEALEFYLADKVGFLIERNSRVNPADRPDLRQDVMLAIFINVRNGKFDPSLGELGGYAYQVARNRINDHLKRIREKSLDNLAVDPPQEDPADVMDEAERQMIKQAIMSLPPKHQEVLLLHFFEGLQMNEVSQRLNIPAQKAYNLKNYALQLLRAQLSGTDFFKILFPLV